MSLSPIRIFVLRGGGLLAVGPDGRSEPIYEPMIPDGASATQVREILAMHVEHFDRAIADLGAPVIDLAKESTPAPVGSGGE